MRSLVLAVLVLLTSTPTWATIARVQFKANFTGSWSTCAATFTTKPAAHDLVVFWTSWKPSTATASVHESHGNTNGDAVGPTTQPASGVKSQISYLKNVAGSSSNIVTATYNASTATCSVVTVEYGGADQDSRLDVTSANTGAGTMLESSVTPPTFVNEFVFEAGSVNAGSASPGHRFESMQAGGAAIAEDDVLISNGQQHATAATSSSENWAMQMATFHDSSTSWNESTAFSGNVYFKLDAPWFDVKAFGAVCDGVTDDTKAITAAVTAWSSNLSGTASSAGVLYFPRSPHPCKFNGNVFNVTHNQGWLYVLMDNSFLLTGPVTPTPLTAFVGRGGNFQGLGGMANLHPNVTWLPSASGVEALNITGNVGGLYFEGINFENNGGSLSPVHLRGTSAAGGPTFITWIGDQFGANSSVPAFLVDSDRNNIVAAYGMFFDHCAFSSPPGSSAVIQVTNAGNFVFRDGPIYGAPVVFKNLGISSAGEAVFDGVLSESLINQDFLVLDTSAGGGVVETDFTLRNVALADTSGTVYLVKGLGTGNRGINIEMSPEGGVGSGIIDPASTDPQGLRGVHCKGAGCDLIPSQITTTMIAGFYGLPTNGKSAYSLTGSAAGGSAFMPSPVIINGSQDFLGVSNSYVSGSNNVAVGAGRMYIDSLNGGFACIQHSLAGCPLGTSATPWLNLFLGGHFNQASSNSDIAGTLSCSGGTKMVTFTAAFTSTPVIIVSDETTAGGARVSAHSTSGFTVTCTGATDAFDYLVIGNPN
jgi:hypothetical protein